MIKFIFLILTVNQQYDYGFLYNLQDMALNVSCSFGRKILYYFLKTQTNSMEQRNHHFTPHGPFLVFVYSIGLKWYSKYLFIFKSFRSLFFVSV